MVMSSRLWFLTSVVFVVEKTRLDMRSESGKVTAVVVKAHCEATTRLLMLDTKLIGRCRFPYGIPSLVNYSPILLRRSLADSFASSEALGLLRVLELG
jgi:hypothetical protein